MSLEVGDIAYLAGIIDTQARLTKRKSVSTYLPQIDLNTPNRELLDVFSSMTGTAAQVRRRAYSKSGCTEHCPEQHQHVFSISGHWSVTGARATIILFNIEPYCRIRQRLVQELVVVGLSAPWKPASLRKMQELGWSIPHIQEQPESSVATRD